MFERLGSAVIAHPWRVIGAWAIGAAIVLSLSPQLVTFTSNNNSSFLPGTYESVQAQAVAARYFPSVSGASGVVLTYTATLGVITLVFVGGFGFDGLDFTIPIVAYLFVMAIGTDYNILIASRLREEFHAGKPPREASRLAIVHGAPAVSAAALILGGTFASLILTDIQLLEEIGLAVALGVLLAANILATRIVPTLAALRGWHFWWPHRTHDLVAADREELLGTGSEPVPAGRG